MAGIHCPLDEHLPGLGADAGEDETTGRKEFRWERSGPDHYVFATIYCRIGLGRFQNTMAKIFGGRNVMEGIPKGQIVDDDGVQLLWDRPVNF